MFVASLGLCAWSYAFVLGRSAPLGGWAPIAVDARLITMFALHHSLFARDPRERRRSPAPSQPIC